MEKHQFRVIIVGGSIAGLTLAHCLSRAGIDYVILEKRAEIAPQEGASIGIMPNGARILEQLGLYRTLEELVHPLEEAHVMYPDGFSYSTQYPRLLRERFGFPLAFLDRQKVLEILAAALPHPEKLHLNTEVVQVERAKSRPRVYINDGSYYDGDLVVGADGVHSKVRGDMWRSANILPQHERKQMLAKYACVFGISSSVPNLSAGKQITCYNNSWSILSVIGKNDRVYWFLFRKLTHEYQYGSAPRYSTSDAVERCALLEQEPFWGETRFGDLWARRETFNMTVLEEYVLEQWYWGNIVCIGDSVHKIAPHTGQGANCAMEDAAALATALQQLLHDPSQPPSSIDLADMLGSFTHSRRTRMVNVAYAAKMAMRLHAQDGHLLRLLGRYYVPYTGDMPADRASKGIAGAPIVGFLPVPQRCTPGWQQFGKQEQRRRSLVSAGILLLIAGILWIILFSSW